MASRQSAFRLFAALSIALALAAGAAIPAHAQIAWTNYTTGSGLGNNSVYGVYAQGSTIYAATNNGGLSVSANNGTNWTTYTTTTESPTRIRSFCLRESTSIASLRSGMDERTMTLLGLMYTCQPFPKAGEQRPRKHWPGRHPRRLPPPPSPRASVPRRLPTRGVG